MCEKNGPIRQATIGEPESRRPQLARLFLRKQHGAVLSRRALLSRPLTGGFFFALSGRLATVFVRLLRIRRLFASHIAGIEVELALGIFAGNLLIWVFVIGHRTLL
jgi:hypothetical protein